jgi:hypothetical protein
MEYVKKNTSATPKDQVDEIFNSYIRGENPKVELWKVNELNVDAVVNVFGRRAAYQVRYMSSVIYYGY